MNKKLTLGSLFDGSGGFPLGAVLTGIKPQWSSEVEPFPIRVTTKRLPNVKHYGDINKIDGSQIPPVDIITAGFCCQDLSVAGKRAGLQGERSGLFYQIPRIIKEMRAATNNEYPKYAVLENVPGIYSSAGGVDFLEVLNELIHIKDESADAHPGLSIPMPESGKWSTSGEIVGDGFSIGWRTLDAQFWGVAQRRRRCYIVVDFTGERAGQVLFDESRLRGNPPQGCFPWETIARDTADCLGNAVTVLNDQGGSFMDLSENVTGTLRSEIHGHQPIVFEPGAVSRVGGHVWQGEPTGALRADMGDNQLAVVYDARGNGNGDVVNTITGDHNNRVTDYTALVMNERQYALTVGEEVANTLTGTDYKGTQCVFEPKTLKIRSGCEGGGKGVLVLDNKSATISCNNDQTVFVPKVYGICSKNSNSMKSANPISGIYEADTARTLDTSAPDPNKNAGGMAVVAVEGNGSRSSHRGDGYSEKDVSFSLNTVDKHGVAYGIDRAAFNQGVNALYKPQFDLEQSATVVAKGPNAVACPYKTENRYVVRRLTPTECALLQGFPPDWCVGLETPEPTEDDIAFWSDVWETHRKINNTSSKPKSRNQIIKWLSDPHSDSVEYKMWGNGVALPCVVFVLGGIVSCTQ